MGDISATRIDGYLSLTSNVGTVTASDVAGLDEASTEVGDLKVELRALRRNVDIGTDVGDVVVGVAEELDLEVIAEPRAGWILTCRSWISRRAGNESLAG